MNAAVDAYVNSILGPTQDQGTLTRRAGRVVVVVDEAGEHWVVKTVPSGREFRRELHAYTHWVPHFADQAAQLRNADPALRTLILQRLPGFADWSFEPADHRDAGRLLRRIHTAAPVRNERPDIGALTADKLALSLKRVADRSLLTPDELEFTRKGITVLRNEFGHLDKVPCHGDYGGHNWLRGSGRMRVIDFSTAAYNAAASDFARNFIGPWWERPDLVTAFFEGYGRPITDEELACVRHQLPTFAVSLISHGRRHGDTEMEHRGHYRLHKLMAGHDYTRQPRGLRRAYHAARRLIADARPTPKPPSWP